MLTIKVYAPDGSTFVREAEAVLECVEKDGTHVVKYWSKDYPTAATLTEGQIYVMNDNGKTVADYHLYPKASEPENPPE